MSAEVSFDLLLIFKKKVSVENEKTYFGTTKKLSNEDGMVIIFEFPAFLFQYGSDDHAEFLCVVSREVASNATDENGPQHTDKAKVNKS